MKSLLHYGMLALLTVVLSLPVQANTASQQRSLFFQAENALERGDLETFQYLSNTLTHYPLYFYLRYRYLEPRLANVSDGEILQFLTAYGDTGHGDLLRRKWLYMLAERGDWAMFMRAMQGHTLDEKYVTLRCHYLTAQLNSGQSPRALKSAIMPLWLTGKSQPAACDPAFNALYRNNLLDDATLWQRIQLAMAAGELGVATAISQQFNQPSSADWVALWQTMHNAPQQTLNNFNAPDSPLARTIIVHGIQRIVNKEYEQGNEYWQTFRTRYAFTVAELSAVKAALTLAAYQQNHPQAYQLMIALLGEQMPDKLTESRFQSALKRLDWPAIADFVQELPAETQQELQWQYWQGRALMELGQRDASGATGQQILQKVAQKRDYYGFLAAERLGQAHQIIHAPTPTSAAEEARLLKHPSVAAAKTFFELDLMTHARREWFYITEKLTPQELAVVSVLAHRWGWYDRAIFTIAKAGLFDDLNLRFPLAYYDELLAGAKTQQLDLAWVYGITRQESAFMHSVSSHAGALGLMQLMPATGRYVARRIGINIRSNADILQLDNNVMLGTAYLKQMLNTFDGNYMLATAAYNAGPGRAKRWAEQYGCLPTDVWVELIPFDETRTYVRRVMFYTRIFESQLKRDNPKPLRLSLAGRCNS